MDLRDLISSLSNTPYLFVGAGLSRRYLGLPDWETLLRHFAAQISDDEFVYANYENRAGLSVSSQGLLPKIAQLIEKDYNEKWFSDSSIRTTDSDLLQKIHDHVSPFKIEIASYLKNNFTLIPGYEEERLALAALAKNSIRGIITTNYDCLLENLIPDFRSFVGQQELIFSPIHGVGEIYKIHGSVENPSSIIIDENDYEYFNSHCSYLAAKLLTIFMEYPIIFIGYSISDNNIRNILMSISECLDDNQLKRLGSQMIFVEFNPSVASVLISDHSILLNDKVLTMRKVQTADFLPLYTELACLKTRIPVSVLRRFKEDIYEFVVTNDPTEKMRVAPLDSDRLNDDDLVLAIGRASEFGLKGLSGMSIDEWYYSLVMDSIEYTPDELLKYAYPKLNKQNTYQLPAWKYVYLSKEEHPEVVKQLEDKMKYEDIISNTIRKSRKRLGDYSSVEEIWEGEKKDLNKATELIAYLKPEQIDCENLEMILKIIFNKYSSFENMTPSLKTKVRRLIKIWDCLKWRNKKERTD